MADAKTTQGVDGAAVIPISRPAATDPRPPVESGHPLPGTDEQAAPVAQPDYPAALKGDKPARDMYDYCKQMLEDLGTWDNTDQFVLEQLCVYRSLFLRARRKCKNKEVVKTANGNEIYSPWFTTMNKASDQIRKFTTDLGLSPADRAKVLKAAGHSGAGPLF